MVTRVRAGQAAGELKCIRERVYGEGSDTGMFDAQLLQQLVGIVRGALCTVRLDSYVYMHRHKYTQAIITGTAITVGTSLRHGGLVASVPTEMKVACRRRTPRRRAVALGSLVANGRYGATVNEWREEERRRARKYHASR